MKDRHVNMHFFVYIKHSITTLIMKQLGTVNDTTEVSQKFLYCCLLLLLSSPPPSPHTCICLKLVKECSYSYYYYCYCYY